MEIHIFYTNIVPTFREKGLVVNCIELDLFFQGGVTQVNLREYLRKQNASVYHLSKEAGYHIDLPRPMRSTIKELEEYDEKRDPMFFECADMLYMMG